MSRPLPWRDLFRKMKRPTPPATTGSKAGPAGSSSLVGFGLSQAQVGIVVVRRCPVCTLPLGSCEHLAALALLPAGPAGPGVEGKEGKAGADDARYGGDEGGESKGTDAAPTAVVPGKPNRADHPSAAHRTGDGMQGEEKQVVVDAVLLAKAGAGDVVALRALPVEELTAANVAEVSTAHVTTDVPSPSMRAKLVASLAHHLAATRLVQLPPRDAMIGTSPSMFGACARRRAKDPHAQHNATSHTDPPVARSAHTTASYPFA